QLPSYVPGRSAPGAIKLASNEVPFGPLPGVVEAITDAAKMTHRYPDMGVVALRDKLADKYGVDPQRVATGCGSVAMAGHLCRATRCCTRGAPSRRTRSSRRPRARRVSAYRTPRPTGTTCRRWPRP